MTPVKVHADEWSSVPPDPSSQQYGQNVVATYPQTNQELFASPEDAVKSLRIAVEANDREALVSIFGPQVKSLLTGDKALDAANRRHFAMAMQERCNLDRQGDNEIILEVGTNDWPMPIPLVKSNGQWYFDTVAGKEEVINRHIGRDELTAIGICRDYVRAQQQFASDNGGVYAQKFKSTTGKRDGLYWTSEDNEPGSAFGPLVAEAGQEGEHKGAQPFHGYYFKILTAQGSDAPGGSEDYMSGGQLKKGFALVAYPQDWGHSGIMTFIVNQDGTVYQRDFGPKTSRLALRVKEYNPDKNWTLVHDEGILDAASSQ